MAQERDKLQQQLYATDDSAKKLAISQRMLAMDAHRQASSDKITGAVGDALGWVADRPRAIRDYGLRGIFEGIDSDRESTGRALDEKGIPNAAAHATIQAAGRAAQVGGNFLEAPFEAAADVVSATTNPMSKALFSVATRSIAEGLTDSSAMKWAMKEAEADPQLAKELVSMLRATDLMGIKHMGGPHINAMLQNTITKLEGFYKGPVGAVNAFTREGAKGLPNAVRQQVDPQAIANLEAKGTGQTRIDEATGAGNKSEEMGSIEASGFVAKQTDNRTTNETLIERGPTARLENKGTVRWGETEKVDKLLSSELDNPEGLPEDALEWFKDTTERGLTSKPSANPLRFLKNDVLPRITNFEKDPVGDTLFNVRNKNSGIGELSDEALGELSTGSFLQRRLRKGGYNKFRATTGQPDTFESFSNFVKVSSAFEKGAWNKLPKNLRYGPQANTMQKYLEAQKKPLATRTPKQAALVDAVDKQIDSGVPWLVDKEKQTIKYATNHLSSAKDLGGVGHRAYFDYANGRTYSTIIDGHDMFGTNPAGGVGLWNSTAIQEAPLGPGHVTRGKRQDVDKATMEAATQDLEQATGMMRHQKETGPEYVERIGVPRRPKETIPQYAERTGTKQRKTDENPFQHEKRVLRDYQAPVSARHRAEAAKNIGMMSGSAFNPETDAQTAGMLPTYLLSKEEQEKQQYLRKNLQAGNVNQRNSKQLYRT